MPVQYPEGVLKSHNHTRTANCASLFDVSHMGQLRLTGKDRVSFLESLVVGDIAALGAGEACLSLITNEQGGIIDDTVITNAGDHIYMVVNAGNKVLFFFVPASVDALFSFSQIHDLLFCVDNTTCTCQ
jgi:aminomethyltransferase